MRTDKIDAIESYNDPNSCDRTSNEPLYTITDVDGTELLHQTKDDVVDYVRDELTTTLFKINKAHMEDDDEEAFEIAKKYLEQFSAIEKEN
ncbi:hypothetical protein FAX13_06075 [Ligilactobacillus animalis]|nr:hypothetical protein FAX13_06075 [Ligilactobacillus animalis]